MAAQVDVITPLQLTLRSFRQWVPYFGNAQVSDLQKLARLQNITYCAENYSWASDDLVNNTGLVGANRPNLIELLRYYTNAMRRALDAFLATASLVLAADPTVATLRLHIGNIDNNLGAAALAAGVAGFAVNIDVGNGFNVPNGSITELVVKTRFDNVAPQPNTLVGFRNMITPLALCQNNRARPAGVGPDRYNGLPFVLFACVSHTQGGNPIPVVGTSLDQWTQAFLTDSSRDWRQGRFVPGPMTANIDNWGQQVHNSFSAAKTAAAPAPNPTTYAYYNQVNTNVFQTAPILPQQFGFNSTNHVGRPFAGRNLNGDGNLIQPNQMWQEMCRCWKCRYLHHYNVNAGAPAIQVESYTQTAFTCNRPRLCAEDLTEYYCQTLPPLPGSAAAPIPVQPVAIV